MRLFVGERELITKEVMAFASQAEGEREDGRELATRQVQLSLVVHFTIPPKNIFFRLSARASESTLIFARMIAANSSNYRK
jgi:hypothetical protein